MTTDDFEWVEYGFDTWYFMHKSFNFAAAKVHHYHGWHVVVQGQAPGDREIIVDSLDAAKPIATLLVAQHIEEYQDVTRYGKRSSTARRKAISKGVFRVD